MKHPSATESEPFAEAPGEPPGDSADRADIGRSEQRLRADAARNRQRVLEAAAVVFAERGLDVSLDEVARAAGVGVGTVYRRFPNKEALIEALFEDKVENMNVLVREAASFDDPWDGFVHFLQHAIESQMRNRGLREMLLRDFNHAGLVKIRDAIAPIMSTIIERAQQAGKLRSDVVVNDVPMLVTMLGAVSDYVGPSDPELWRRYLVLILDSLVVDRSDWTPLSNPPSQSVVDAAMTRRR